MKRKALNLVFLFTVDSAVSAVQRPYEDGKVLDIQQKMNTRVLYYQVNTPITQDDPYYEVSVQVGSTIYVGQYTPRHSSDTLPDDLTVTSPVQVRMEKRHMFLKRPGGSELDLVITKRVAAKLGDVKTQASPSTDR
jgi:hypothetical protein